MATSSNLWKPVSRRGPYDAGEYKMKRIFTGPNSHLYELKHKFLVDKDRYIDLSNHGNLRKVGKPRDLIHKAQHLSFKIGQDKLDTAYDQRLTRSGRVQPTAIGFNMHQGENPIGYKSLIAVGRILKKIYPKLETISGSRSHSNARVNVRVRGSK